MNKQTISTVLKDSGISPALSGYHYSIYAIDLMANDISLMNDITKKLYPTVAKKFNTTASRVERAICHAVKAGWNRGNQSLQNKLFGYTIDSNKGRPTNTEFIVTVADYLIMQSETNGE